MRRVSRPEIHGAIASVAKFPRSLRSRRECRPSRGRVEAIIKASRRQRKRESGKWPALRCDKAQRKSVGVFQVQRSKAPIELYETKFI